jgi:hypothetical protein
MNSWKKYGVGGMFFLLPFFVNPFTTNFDMMLEPPKLVALFLLGNLFFSLYLAKAVHGSVGFVHGVIASLVVLTGFGSTQLFPFTHWIVSVFIALWFLQQSSQNQLYILRCLTLSGSVLAIYSFIQFFDLDPIFNYAPGIDRTNPIAFMGQTTKHGAWIATIAVVALAIRDWPSFFLCAASALATQSSFTVAALCAGIFVNLRWGFFRHKRSVLKVGAVLASIGAIAYLCKPNAIAFMDHGRFTTWKQAIYLVVDNDRILTGFGPGSFQKIYPTVQKHELQYGYFVQTHNDYIQAFFEGGLLGLVAITVILGFILLEYFNTWWNNAKIEVTHRAALAGFASLAINAIGNFPFQLAPHFMLGIIFCFIILRNRNEKHGSKLTFHT